MGFESDYGGFNSSGSGSVSPSTNLAKTLFVDTNGSDITGTKGDLLSPYATIGAALLASSSGDDIVVFAGSYTISVATTFTGRNLILITGAFVTTASDLGFVSSNLLVSTGASLILTAGNFSSDPASVIDLASLTSLLTISGNGDFTAYYIMGQGTVSLTNNGSITLNSGIFSMDALTIVSCVWNGTSFTARYVNCTGVNTALGSDTYLLVNENTLNVDLLEFTYVTNLTYGFSCNGSHNTFNIKKLRNLNGSILNSNGNAGFGENKFNNCQIDVNSTVGAITLGWCNSDHGANTIFNNCTLKNSNVSGISAIFQITNINSYNFEIPIYLNNCLLEATTAVFYNTLSSVTHHTYITSCYSNIGNTWTTGSLVNSIEAITVNVNVSTNSF